MKGPTRGSSSKKGPPGPEEAGAFGLRMRERIASAAHLDMYFFEWIELVVFQAPGEFLDFSFVL